MVASRAAVPLGSFGGQGRGPLRRVEHFPPILSILPILSKAVPQSPLFLSFPYQTLTNLYMSRIRR